MAGVTGIVVWKLKNQNTFVLIVGGTDKTRQDLIRDIRTNKGTEPYRGSGIYDIMFDKLSRGGNLARGGIGKRRAALPNWNIEGVEENAANLKELLKRAKMVIVILTGQEEADELDKIIYNETVRQVPHTCQDGNIEQIERSSCIVVNFVDEISSSLHENF